MKVNEPRPSEVKRPDATPDESATKETRGKDEKKSFSKAMQKVRDKSGEEPAAGAVPPGAGQQPGMLRRDVAVTEAKAARGSADAVLAENLAKEIVVTTRGADDHQVSIQFDSKTLAGLRVQIDRQGGMLSIRLYTQTDDSTRQVTANVDQLAQALQAKGLPLESIQVQGPGKREETRRYHQRDGRQGGGGQQQGRRQNQ